MTHEVATPVPLDRTFDWSGARVRWGCIGDGPPVVLCHGTPWSSFVWRHLARHLCAEWRIHVWDMVGYGMSDMPDADVSLAAQGRLLAALAEHWQLDRPHVVAHDIGGAVALRAHLLHGTEMRSLTLVDVVALRPWGSPFFRLVAAHPEVFAALPPRLHAALVREYIAGASATGLDPTIHDALVAPWLGDGQPAFYRQIAQAAERHTDDVENRLHELTVPTMVVWGTEDDWVPVDRAHRLAAAVPGATLELLTGAGHLVQEDRPDELTDVVSDWLRSHRS